MTRACILVAAATAALLGAPAAPAANPVQRENARPGTSAWLARAGGDIALYAWPVGGRPGTVVGLHVSSAHRYRLVVYRLGWYGGKGARLVACVPSCGGDLQGTAQPLPQAGSNPSGPPLVAGWPVSASLHTGAGWTTGYYLIEALLTSGPDAGRVATAFFVLREPRREPASQVLVQVPVNTWQAYNRWGGKSLYDFFGPRAYRVSFLRPYGQLAQSPLWWELQLVRFLEREGYDVSYQTDLATDAHPASLLRHRLVVVAGHDEYWTAAIRDAFDAALAAGTNLAFLGANDGYWRVRYEDGRSTVYSVKSLYDPAPGLADKTAMFRELGRPECRLMGVQHVALHPLDHPLDYAVTAPATDPWLRGTGLAPGDRIAGIVSREHDSFTPCGDYRRIDVLLHYEGGAADASADAVRILAPSGARVFSAGTLLFSWALDGWRSDGSLGPAPEVDRWQVPADPRVQRFMRNALADLTRPAPPSSLLAVRVRGGIRVSVAASSDPRVTGFVAAAHAGGRWLPLCRGALTCTGIVHVRRVRLVGAVALDRWGRRSEAVYALPLPAR